MYKQTYFNSFCFILVTCFCGCITSHAKFAYRFSPEAKAAICPISRKNTGSSSTSFLSDSTFLKDRDDDDFVELIALRGGEEDVEGDDDEDEEEEEESAENDNEEEEEEDGVEENDGDNESAVAMDATVILSQVMKISSTAFEMASKVAMQTIKATQRAIKAGLSGEEGDDNDDDDEKSKTPKSLPTRIINTGQRMIKAALTSSDEDDDTLADAVKSKATSDSDLSTAVIMSKVGDLTKGVFTLATKIVTYTVGGIQRAVKAGLETEEGDDKDSSTSLPEQIINTISRMAKAAFSVPSGDALASSVKSKAEEEDDDDEKYDFGTFFSESYEVADGRDERGPEFLGGSLSSALEAARSKARLLVVFIPAGKPPSSSSSAAAGTEESADQIAIKSMLSKKVAKVSNKPGRKSSNSELGSYMFWGAKAGSSESTTAMKFLKRKPKVSKGEKRPMLLIVYPAKVKERKKDCHKQKIFDIIHLHFYFIFLFQISLLLHCLSLFCFVFPPFKKAVDSSGETRMIPKILAQHHCGPPPDETMMVGWLKSFRKRHGKQYTIMQTELKELGYWKERKEGYSDSVKSDTERKQREKELEEKKLAEEKAEKERLEAIEARRAELKESLPDDDTSSGAKKVAVRFADGRSEQRGFAADETLTTIFNWVDVTFEMERERVILTTMNGKKSFSWDDETNDQTLEEAGLGKKTGFRVSEKQVDTTEKEEEEDGDDNDDEKESKD